MNLWSAYAVWYVFDKFQRAYPKQNYTQKYFWEQALEMELIVAEDIPEEFQAVELDQDSDQDSDVED